MCIHTHIVRVCVCVCVCVYGCVCVCVYMYVHTHTQKVQIVPLNESRVQDLIASDIDVLPHPFCWRTCLATLLTHQVSSFVTLFKGGKQILGICLHPA